MLVSRAGATAVELTTLVSGVVTGFGRRAVIIGIAPWQALAGLDIAPHPLVAALRSAAHVYAVVVKTYLAFHGAVDVGGALLDTFVVDTAGKFRIGAVGIRHAVTGNFRYTGAKIASEPDTAIHIPLADGRRSDALTVNADQTTEIGAVLTICAYYFLKADIIRTSFFRFTVLITHAIPLSSVDTYRLNTAFFLIAVTVINAIGWGGSCFALTGGPITYFRRIFPAFPIAGTTGGPAACQFVAFCTSRAISIGLTGGWDLADVIEA